MNGHTPAYGVMRNHRFPIAKPLAVGDVARGVVANDTFEGKVTHVERENGYGGWVFTVTDSSGRAMTFYRHELHRIESAELPRPTVCVELEENGS